MNFFTTVITMMNMDEAVWEKNAQQAIVFN